MVVNSIAYEDGKRIGDISIEDISEVLKRPNTFVWVGLYEPTEALLKQIQEEFCLHNLAIEDALRAHQRPKLEEYGDSLFIVLHTAQSEDRQIKIGETHIFVGERYIVTVRHGTSLSYAPVRQHCESKPQLLGKGTSYALYAIMDFVVDNYFPIVDVLEEDLERLEEAIFGKFNRHNTEQLYELKRKVMAIRRAITPLAEICNTLVRFHSNFIPKEARPYFRDIYDHTLRIIESIDNMREMLTAALQVNVALVALGQSEITKKLAGWGAILAVPTLISSIYGMNFRHMPELDTQFGYPFALLIMTVICGALYRKLKRAGWL